MHLSIFISLLLLHGMDERTMACNDTDWRIDIDPWELTGSNGQRPRRDCDGNCTRTEIHEARKDFFIFNFFLWGYVRLWATTTAPTNTVNVIFILDWGREADSK